MDTFAQAIVTYFVARGRKQLPWQHPRTPYRVWVSEVMLQQTQVDRVMHYFERFVGRFPDVASLAVAASDEVMSYWSGLGYYARGRNLHQAAKLMVEHHRSQVPKDFDALLALPGIGRSTAGAIRASAFGLPTPILDANVRRVLSRYHALRGVRGESRTEKRLWQLAEAHTPRSNIREYTQGIMDFGANLCRKANPDCARCPLADTCRAFAEGAVDELPLSARRAQRPLRRVRAFVVTNREGHILLELRPEKGVWGGLWTFPERGIDMPVSEFVAELDALAKSSVSAQSEGFREVPALPDLRVQFTHFQLEIRPVRLLMDCHWPRHKDASLRWVHPAECERLGMPSVAKRLLVDILH